MATNTSPTRSAPPPIELARADRAYLVEQLRTVANAVVSTLGEGLCEVVMHDFAHPENSITFIQGRVTKRGPGGSMSQIGLAMMADGNDAEDRINYITRTRSGKVFRSSTVALRDRDGDVFGAFCINIDITELVALESVLKELVTGDDSRVHTNIHFSNDTAEVAQVMLEEVVQQLSVAGPPRDIDERLQLVGALEKRGFFGIRYSVPLLADYLGVSRATIYNYVERSKEA